MHRIDFNTGSHRLAIHYPIDKQLVLQFVGGFLRNGNSILQGLRDKYISRASAQQHPFGVGEYGTQGATSGLSVKYAADALNTPFLFIDSSITQLQTDGRHLFQGSVDGAVTAYQ